jgi:adenosylhomocysteine nucleosidase
MARIAIISALFREVHPLVRKWEVLRYLPDHAVTIYHNERAVVAYAGMGQELATRACRAALACGEISAFVSAGWAGGLNPLIAPGEVVRPKFAVDAATGERYQAGGNRGALVTVARIADAEEKQRLASLHGGDLVDMEAAAVARFAQERNLPFYALKAISDAHDASLPDMNKFNRNGQFSVWRFLAYIAIRPGLWSTISEMSQRSLASRDALCKELEKWIAGEVRPVTQQQLIGVHDETLVGPEGFEPPTKGL